MKKIFLFFAALFTAIAMNAATSINPGTNTLHTALHAANAGDTIVLADGTYVENISGADNYIAFHKNLVIMAAEDAHPVIDMYIAISVKNGALVEVKGLKFDATHVMEANLDWAHHILYAEDANNNRVIFDGCEFCNDTINDASFYCGSDFKIDSLVFKNCYIHDITKSILWLGNANAKVKILNSTISNITPRTYTTSYWCAPLYMSAATGNLEVDHCTFYNVVMMSDGYGSITVDNFANVAITNSVFQMPSSVDRCIAKVVTGANVRNCVAYNYDNWQPFSWDNKATITACTKGDPKFKDAANDDFTLGAGSAALVYVGKKADMTTNDTLDLGDLFWVPAPRTIYCKADKAWWKEANAAVGAYAFYDNTMPANADWPGVRMTAVDGEADVWEVEISAKYPNIIFTRVNPGSEGDFYWNTKTADLVIPSNKNMYTITSETKQTGDNVAEGSWSLKDCKYYITGNAALVGEENAWHADAVASMADSYTFENLPAGKYQLKVVDGSWKGIADLTAVAGGLYYDQDGNVCFILENAGDVTITYNAATPVYTVTGTFAAPEVKLIGINGWTEATDAIALTPADDKKSASVTLELTDWWYDFKVIRAGEWLGKTNEGTENYKIHKDYNWVDALVRDYEGLKAISLQPSDINKNYTFTWNYADGKLTVTFPSETAIDNTEVEQKAVKVLKNGQLFIEKGNKIYNVLGVQIR